MNKTFLILGFFLLFVSLSFAFHQNISRCISTMALNETGIWTINQSFDIGSATCLGINASGVSIDGGGYTVNNTNFSSSVFVDWDIFGNVYPFIIANLTVRNITTFTDGQAAISVSNINFTDYNITQGSGSGLQRMFVDILNDSNVSNILIRNISSGHFAIVLDDSTDSECYNSRFFNINFSGVTSTGYNFICSSSSGVGSTARTENNTFENITFTTCTAPSSCGIINGPTNAYAIRSNFRNITGPSYNTFLMQTSESDSFRRINSSNLSYINITIFDNSTVSGAYAQNNLAQLFNVTISEFSEVGYLMNYSENVTMIYSPTMNITINGIFVNNSVLLNVSNAPIDPSGFRNISYYFNLTNASALILDANLTYFAREGIDELTYEIYVNTTAWTLITGVLQSDALNRLTSATINSGFHGIFGEVASSSPPGGTGGGDDGGLIPIPTPTPEEPLSEANLTAGGGGPSPPPALPEPEIGLLPTVTEINEKLGSGEIKLFAFFGDVDIFFKEELCLLSFCYPNILWLLLLLIAILMYRRYRQIPMTILDIVGLILVLFLAIIYLPIILG